MTFAQKQRREQIEKQNDTDSTNNTFTVNGNSWDEEKNTNMTFSNIEEAKLISKAKETGENSHVTSVEEIRPE